MDHIKRNPNVGDIGIFVSEKPKPKGLKVCRKQKSQMRLKRMGLYLQKWHLSGTAQLIQFPERVTRLEVLKETKTPNALKVHRIAFSEEGFIWNSAANPISRTSHEA